MQRYPTRPPAHRPGPPGNGVLCWLLRHYGPGLGPPLAVGDCHGGAGNSFVADGLHG